MRYAVIADLHGHADNFERIMNAAGRDRVDQVVLAGDYLDAKVSKRKHDPSVRRPLDRVVNPDPPLWKRLAEHLLVRGNQEERIADLLRPDQVGAELAPLLAAPGSRLLGGAVLVEHGHGFDWTRLRDRWVPGARDLGRPGIAWSVLCYGHSHQRLVAVLHDGGAGAREPEFLDAGRPVELRAGRRYLLNLGAAREPAAHWLCYDAAAGTAEFREAGR